MFYSIIFLLYLRFYQEVSVTGCTVKKYKCLMIRKGKRYQCNRIYSKKYKCLMIRKGTLVWVEKKMPLMLLYYLFAIVSLTGSLRSRLNSAPLASLTPCHLGLHSFAAHPGQLGTNPRWYIQSQLEILSEHKLDGNESSAVLHLQ